MPQRIWAVVECDIFVFFHRGNNKLRVPHRLFSGGSWHIFLGWKTFLEPLWFHDCHKDGFYGLATHNA